MNNLPKPKRHKHYKEIIAFAEGYQIQLRPEEGYEWRDVAQPSWDISLEYRVNPENQETTDEISSDIKMHDIRVNGLDYIPTSLTHTQLVSLTVEHGFITYGDVLENIANLAIKRFICDTYKAVAKRHPSSSNAPAAAAFTF